MIRKLKSGQYRLYSRKINPRTGKRRNLGTFPTRAKAEKPRVRTAAAGSLGTALRRRTSSALRRA
jgi:hypothetical protein